MKRTIGAIVLCLACVSAVAHGEISVKHYRELQSKDQLNNEWLQGYIVGLGKGFAWANAVLVSKGRPKVYCPPRQLALNAKNYLDILDSELQGKDGDTYTVIELALLRGLMHVFPCP